MLAIRHICPACGREFKARPQAVYCSAGCRQRAQRRRELGLAANAQASGKRYSLRRLARELGLAANARASGRRYSLRRLAS